MFTKLFDKSYDWFQIKLLVEIQGIIYYIISTINHERQDWFIRYMFKL